VEQDAQTLLESALVRPGLVQQLLNVLYKCAVDSVATEYITEFSIWAIANAPLLIATEIRDMPDEKQAIVLNKVCL